MKKSPPIPPMVPLRALRQAYGLTSPALAGRIAEYGVSVDPDHLIAVELGQSGASRELLTAWARALNVNPLDIRRPADLREILSAEVAESTPSPSETQAGTATAAPGTKVTVPTASAAAAPGSGAP
jgi:transcriptional regulator with XRE-family HTH domain